MDSADARAPYHVRVDFIIELARRLHMYGTTAQRLEGAVTSVARRIDVYCEVWSNPTGMILSFADFQRSVQSTSPASSASTRARTTWAGWRAPTHRRGSAGRAHAHPDGLEACARSTSRRRATPRRCACCASGWLRPRSPACCRAPAGPTWHRRAARLLHRRAVAAGEAGRAAGRAGAIAAMVATFIATAIAHFVAPLSLQNVIVASLIVLMPGLTLTTAVSELSAKQLASGTARFADAMTTLMKLTFGTVAAA
jgi:hypothetical protein